MSRFLSARYANISAYVPGAQPRDRRYIKLNTNESPYPPCPGVTDALARADAVALRLYPDPEAKRLTAAIAARYTVDESMVLPTNGSDEALALCFQAYAGSAMRYPDVTYGLYKVLAGLYGVRAHEMPVREDFTLDTGDYTACGETVVIANPNAPTGLALSRAEIARIAKSNPDNIILVDEAYVDFGAESCVPLLRECDNLVIVMTYSKSRCLAGARLGFVLSSKEIIDDLRALKDCANPYNISALTQALGEIAMADEDYLLACTARVARTRARVRDALLARRFDALDTRTNFLFVRPPRVDCGQYCEKLAARGVLVRHFEGARVREYARVSVGTDEDMNAFLQATDDILGEAKA